MIALEQEVEELKTHLTRLETMVPQLVGGEGVIDRSTNKENLRFIDVSPFRQVYKQG